jgi:thiamine kinase-like enzyme
MLLKIGKEPLNPEDILKNVKFSIRQQAELQSRIEIRQALNYLDDMIPLIKNQKQVVCHCDMNHNNWLLSSEAELYLIDWDNAMVADPAMDIGMILYWYIPEEDWEDWLTRYGISKDNHLLQRMHWYLIVEVISTMFWHYSKNEQKEAAQRFDELKRLLKNIQL